MLGCQVLLSGNDAWLSCPAVRKSFSVVQCSVVVCTVVLGTLSTLYDSIAHLRVQVQVQALLYLGTCCAQHISGNMLGCHVLLLLTACVYRYRSTPKYIVLVPTRTHCAVNKYQETCLVVMSCCQLMFIV